MGFISFFEAAFDLPPRSNRLSDSSPRPDGTSAPLPAGATHSPRREPLRSPARPDLRSRCPPSRPNLLENVTSPYSILRSTGFCDTASFRTARICSRVYERTSDLDVFFDDEDATTEPFSDNDMPFSELRRERVADPPSPSLTSAPVPSTAVVSNAPLIFNKNGSPPTRHTRARSERAEKCPLRSVQGGRFDWELPLGNFGLGKSALLFSKNTGDFKRIPVGASRELPAVCRG